MSVFAYPTVAIVCSLVQTKQDSFAYRKPVSLFGDRISPGLVKQLQVLPTLDSTMQKTSSIQKYRKDALNKPGFLDTEGQNKDFKKFGKYVL